jgi:hypothetical protein
MKFNVELESILVILSVSLLVVIFYLFFRYYCKLKITSVKPIEVAPLRPLQTHAIFVDLSPRSADIVELAVEIWRIQNRLNKAITDLPDTQKRGLESSIQKLQKYLDTFKIQIVDHTNQKYNEGLNVNVLSFEINPHVSTPTIKETIEPTIICEGKVVRKGKVVVIKKN